MVNASTNRRGVVSHAVGSGGLDHVARVRSARTIFTEVEPYHTDESALTQELLCNLPPNRSRGEFWQQLSVGAWNSKPRDYDDRCRFAPILPSFV